MPVDVHVPIRIRVDAEALRDRPEEVDEALAAALGRALAASRREVLDPRGGYVGVNLTPPQLRWTGAANLVEEDSKRTFEERVRAAIGVQARRARLLELALGAADAPPVLPKEIWERIDPARHHRLLKLYSVPAYQDEGNAEHIEFLDDPGGDKYIYEEKWGEVLAEEDTDERDKELLEEAKRFAMIKKQTTSLGILYKVVGAPEPLRKWQVIIYDKDGKVEGAFYFKAFKTYVFDSEKATPPWREDTFDPPVGEAAAVVNALPKGLGGRIALVRSLDGQQIAADVRKYARQPSGAPLTDDQLKSAVETEIKRRAEQIGKDQTRHVIVTLGPTRLSLFFDAKTETHLKWNGKVRILPIFDQVKKVPEPERKVKPGTEPKPGFATGGASDGTRGEGGVGTIAGDGSGETGEDSGEGIGEGEGRGEGAGSGKKKPNPKRARGGGKKGLFSRECGVCMCEEQDVWERIFGGPEGSTVCQPFLGEPATKDIGGPAQGLIEKWIDEIAGKLSISSCYYPGQFCCHAAAAIHAQALGAAETGEVAPAGKNKAAANGKGNVGPIDFEPAVAGTILRMRTLASCVPLISQLMNGIYILYTSDDHICKMHGEFRGNPIGWMLRFREWMTPAMQNAIGAMFTVSCRSLMLQLLANSKQEIQRRKTRFDTYAPIFERLMLLMLAEPAELIELRSRLQKVEFAETIENPKDAGDKALAAVAWATSADKLTQTFLAFDRVTRSSGAKFEVVHENGIARIRDRHGVLWSMQELNNAIVTGRGAAEGIDPLVKQIVDLPDVFKRFKDNPNAIRQELKKLLDEMELKNKEITTKVVNDPMFAFRASILNENIPGATVPGSRYALQGVHLLVHQSIGDAFNNDGYYALGIDWVFGVEEGKNAVTGFMTMVGIIVLCVFCAPLGFIAGIKAAEHEVDKAREKEDVYKSVIDPDLVIARADVEAELFAAYLGLVLSFIPEAGTAAKGAWTGGRMLLKGELRAIGKAAGKYAARRMAKEIAEILAKDFLKAFIVEMSTNIVISQVMEKLIMPAIMRRVTLEAQITQSVGGTEGAQAILYILDAEARGQ